MSIEDLVVQHAGWIRQKARRYYADSQDADDLASDTIYKCLSQGGRFDSEKSFKPWALAIMVNTYVTQYNRRRSVIFTGIEGHDQYSSEGFADQSARINNILSVIRECNRESRCIECVILYAKGYTYEEIGDRLQILVGTVKSRVCAGRRILREALN